MRKLDQVFAVLRTAFNGEHWRSQKRRMVDLGYTDRPPHGDQILIAGFEMLQTYLIPGYEAYTGRKDFVVRFLTDPGANLDPTGLCVDPRLVCLHLCQTEHSDPRYDLELLALAGNQLTTLKNELQLLVLKQHPRQGELERTVCSNYHQRLLKFVGIFEEAQKERYDIGPMENRPILSHDKKYRRANDRFSTLRRFLRYAADV